MNINDGKVLAGKIEANLPVILAEFSEVLSHRGFGDIEVVSFTVGHKANRPRFRSFDGTPCPTKCVVLPDGRIECKPVC
jgi:hypothetical protein